MYASDYIDSYFDDSDNHESSEASEYAMVMPSAGGEDDQNPRGFDCDCG